MQPSGMHYFPLAWPFLLGLLFLFLVVVLLFEVVLVRTYEKMGIPSRYVWTILLFSLLGSAVNIPVAQFPPEKMVSAGLVNFFGIPYVVPDVRVAPGTVLAVNVGGALIPVLLSIYLLFKNKTFFGAALAVAIVAVATHLLARPVRGVGITLPIFIPPIITVLAAILCDRKHAAPVAYIAGSLGTLIGADLWNLYRVQGLGAPVASIGGAGTFDGIFLTGIVAVLLSPVSKNRERA